MAQPATEPPTIYPPRARARLALSQAARDLSDRARSMVPTLSDGFAHPGERVEAAHHLVQLAEDVLRCAVVYERERGRSWEQIGEALGISRQTAHERFAAAVQEWREALLWPARWEGGTAYGSVLPEGADAPEDYARWLDEWCERHNEPVDPADDRAHQVSGGLGITRNDVAIAEINLVLARARELSRRPAGEVHPAEVRAFEEHKAAVLSYLARLESDDDSIWDERGFHMLKRLPPIKRPES